MACLDECMFGIVFQIPAKLVLRGDYMRYVTMRFEGSRLELLDQRLLPGKVEYFRAGSYRDVVYAIREMVVRGAPAIGAAAAYGLCLAAAEYRHLPPGEFSRKFSVALDELASARPTAVNLVWALKRMSAIADAFTGAAADMAAALEEEADAIAREDGQANRAMGRHGNEIIPPGAKILTICNTGSLATVEWGTALGVVRTAHQAGKGIKVFACETRPRLQGASLTMFELVEEGIPATLIADSVAATLLRDGVVDVVLTGADRIAANGDTANKIGTFMLSQLAAGFGVPFYVVAPLSTIDINVSDGSGIVIEERSGREVTHIRDVPVAPAGIDVFNPAFDVTPAENITGIVTEVGIIRPPFVQGIAAAKGEGSNDG